MSRIHKGVDPEGPVDVVVVVVVMQYYGLEGLPVQVIDSFLNRYPSSVDLRAAEPHTWIETDLDKWVSLLRSKGTIREVSRAATIGLRRYNKSSFGLREVGRLRSRNANPKITVVAPTVHELLTGEDMQ